MRSRLPKKGSTHPVSLSPARYFVFTEKRQSHWDRDARCEVMHHIHNRDSPKEAARWQRRWSKSPKSKKIKVNEILAEVYRSQDLGTPERVSLKSRNVVHESKARGKGKAKANAPTALNVHLDA